MSDKYDIQAAFGRWFRVYEDKGKINVLDAFSQRDLEKGGIHGHTVINEEIDISAPDGGFDAYKVWQSLEYIRDVEQTIIKKKEW